MDKREVKEMRGYLLSLVFWLTQKETSQLGLLIDPKSDSSVSKVVQRDIKSDPSVSTVVQQLPRRIETQQRGKVTLKQPWLRLTPKFVSRHPPIVNGGEH
jgi:hypothetical protein